MGLLVVCALLVHGVDFAAARDCRAKTGEAMASALRLACQEYRQDTGRYPTALVDLLTNPGGPGWQGPYLIKLPKDPWQGEYAYAVRGEDVDIRATGRPAPRPWWKRILNPLHFGRVYPPRS